MKTFIVEKDVVERAKRYAVNSDGTIEGVAWDFEYEEPHTIGFNVQIFNDNEYIDSKYYPVHNNEEEVLEQIKEDFPPNEYQNNNW